MPGMRNHALEPLRRRSFLSRLAAGAAFFGAVAAPATAQTTTGGPWQPARHPQDDWFDQIPGKHRFFLDALTPDGVGEALLFAKNYYAANKSAYGLDDADLAVVVCLRHLATAFAFNDAMWAKYGAGFADRITVEDPATKQVPATNLHTKDLDALVKRGLHFAVCDMASHFFAGLGAHKTGAAPDEVYKDLAANTVGHCHFVAAGIVAVDRAQERGYAIAHVG